MKTSIRIIAAAAICLAAQSSFAQITTFGQPDCGQWLTEKTVGRRAWLVGYLSGMNVVHVVSTPENRNSNPLKELSSIDQAFVWMDDYCRKNPLDNLTFGGLSLFTELMKKEAARR